MEQQKIIQPIIKEVPLDRDLKRGEFKSNEEWHFYQWALEAIEIGIIGNLKYLPWTAQLAKKEHINLPAPTKKDKKKTRKYILFQPCTYTPDFILQVKPFNNPLIKQNLIPVMGMVNPNAPQEVQRYLPSHLGDVLIIEVKGTYSLKHKSDQTFPILRKWLFYHSGMFVNKVVPKNFFKKTWCPQSLRLTEVKKDICKTWIGYPTKEDYMKTNNVIKMDTSAEYEKSTEQIVNETVAKEFKNEKLPK